MTMYPTYRVAGVEMTDPSGRWELTPGADLLPRFPGVRAARWNVPGMPGEIQATYAPPKPTQVSIQLRVNAVGSVANTIVSGGRAARTKAIKDNINLLFYSIALARQAYWGLVEIRRYSSGSDWVKANGRLISSVEPRFNPANDYAELDLVFEIPSGVWMAPSMDVTEARVKAGTTRIKVPAGTAPSVENMVCIKPTVGAHESKYGKRVLVTGGQHGGFKLGLQGKSFTLPASKWTMVNTLYWKVGSTATKYDWGCAKPYKGVLEPSARPMGSALTIVPSAEKDWAYVYITHHDPAPFDVIIRSRKCYY